MHKRVVSLVVIGVIIVGCAALATATTGISTPLFTLRMEQASSGMNFLPTAVAQFMYVTEKGYTVVGLTSAVPLDTLTAPPTCPQTCDDLTCEETCPHTCWNTCGLTCSSTCPQTCDVTCGSTCYTCPGGYTCYSTCPYTCGGNPTCQKTCETCESPCP